MSPLRAAMNATDLRCENQCDPVAVDAAAPRLSWVLEAAARGERQTAYRILVACSAEKLQRDEGDLWDSGKVTSSEQNQIAYAGMPLAANTECSWKVQVWNNDGETSEWSAPARWGMGLLEPTDPPSPHGSGAAGWKARWIGVNPQSVSYMYYQGRAATKRRAATSALGLLRRALLAESR